MTKNQFYTKNNLTLADCSKTNFMVIMEMTLMKHLISQNDVSVRDYVIAIRVLWPKKSDFPISKKLFKNATSFLESRGWHMHLGEDHSRRINRYVTRTR
ncbi:MAG: hypothetical protein JL50_12695 [Peptococcaceae bacterium BICA1-7]|nr:MAG: hypothetical protein JL50_12695 [Peptococcaceae bacterium BICA1-7]HBV97257.1 hypothetical protein [Desulfotomaculum sp.]